MVLLSMYLASQREQPVEGVSPGQRDPRFQDRQGPHLVAVDLEPTSSGPTATNGVAADGPSAEPAGLADQPLRTASVTERAACQLFLRVVGRLDAKPAQSEVELWSLDGGAALYTSATVPPEGLLLADVPEGRYRAHVRARKRESQDPPAFHVRPPRSEVVLEVTTTRTYELHLEVRDERGALVRLGRSSSGYRRVPAFAPDFEALSGGATPDTDLGGFDFGSRHFSVEHDDGRFRLGQVRDLDCDQGGSPWFELRPRERFPVAVELPGHERFSLESYPRADEVLVVLGVTLPEGWFDSALVLPDGRPAREAGARIEARCLARPMTEAELATGEAYKHIPVLVSVELEGYEPLRFDYTLSEGPPGRRELRLR